MPVSRHRKRQKIYGMPTSYGMDRNLKCRVTLYARTWSAAHRQPRQHTGPITRAFMGVLQAMVFHFANSKTGSCFPSYDAIAEKAGCARSTAVDAVKVLEESGVFRVVNRLKRVGDRVLRTSNAYVFRDFIPESENRLGNRESKDSVISTTSKPGIVAVPEVRIIVLDAKNSLDAALIKLGRASGALPWAARQPQR